MTKNHDTETHSGFCTALKVLQKLVQIQEQLKDEIEYDSQLVGTKVMIDAAIADLSSLTLGDFTT